MNKLILVLVLVFAIVGIGGWVYVNKPTTVLQVPTPTPVAVPLPAVPETAPDGAPIEYANPSVVIDAIETAVPAKKWSDLLPFMLPNVNVIKYATSCCGTITKNQAVSELAYLNNAVAPWNFSDTNPIALKLETNDPEHFKGMWIGTSADYHAVGFKWNDKFLIEKVSIANDYRLIIGN